MIFRSIISALVSLCNSASKWPRTSVVFLVYYGLFAVLISWKWSIDRLQWDAVGFFLPLFCSTNSRSFSRPYTVFEKPSYKSLYSTTHELLTLLNESQEEIH